MFSKKIFIVFLLWLFVISVLSLLSLNVQSMPKFPMVDKLVHFTFHCVLVFLLSHSLLLEWSFTNVKKVIRYVILFSLSYGVSIELLQELCTVKRHADVMDVLANTLGGVFGVSMVLILKLYTKQKEE